MMHLLTSEIYNGKKYKAVDLSNQRSQSDFLQRLHCVGFCSAWYGFFWGKACAIA
jgi:hypothetical protein